MNRQKKTCFVIPSVAPETTAAGCGATRSCLHNHGVIEGRTKRVLIAREQSERNRLHTRAREHNANTEEERQQQIAQRRGKKKEEGKDREKEEGKGKKKKTKKNRRISVYNSASLPMLALIFRQLPSLLVNSFNNLYHFQKTFCFS